MGFHPSESLLKLSIALLCIMQAKGQVSFVGLPDTVTLLQSSARGTVVYTFTMENCNSTNPTVTMDASPTTNFFNTPSLTIAGLDYNIEITLSSTVALNADVVNQYILTITATCDNETVFNQLFVMIKNDIVEPQCEPKFSSQAGDTVTVYSNIPASSPIYKVVLRQPNNAPVTYSIIQPSPSVFAISTSGSVLSPTSGFTNAAKTYQLQIKVTDSLGNSCNGTLTVEVLPVYQNPINFTVPSTAVTIRENAGPGAFVTTITAQGNNVQYEMISPNSAYYINADTGIIRTTFNLDLERIPSLASTTLQVRAYDKNLRSSSAIATVNITVLDVNDMAPLCTPAVIVNQVPQTTPIGNILATLTCTDPDVNSTALSYSVISNANSLYSFRMQSNNLVVNNTLNYDSAEIASVNFQYSATIVVTDSGTPQLTTNIPVFITVTPVNNYSPQCIGPLTYSVNENAPFGTVVGQLNATDADYKFNNVEFTIEGGQNPPVFYMDPKSGEIHVLGPLDFETRSSYSLRIQVVDLNNDIMPDPVNQKSTYCTITINVQDYNDNPPVCNPPYYSTTIYSTLVTTSNILSLQCTDVDPTSTLTYSIVGGNVDNLFLMNGNSIRHNPFSYNPDGVYNPVSFTLLVKVTDSTSSPQFSTTAIVNIDVVPWTTTQPTTTTTTTTPEKKTKIVNETSTYWQPDIWFMVVLTITAALLLLALSLLAWKLATGNPICGNTATEATQPLLQNKSVANVENPLDAAKEQPPPPSKDKKDIAPVSPLSLQFDGRAQDPVTGREYLFNSHTGERRWL
ncbi:cadherin-related family member 4 [Pelobates cultripes]|uniref:Cadherin-related family member 4 n=1 Tax=Pelobates cultripes TaxID=61616 RepID=A0AAD1SXW0_PELCU|nr:cadherin-related family member 4 [Pelobates cultripes]